MELQDELERIGAAYGQVRASEYVQLVELGEIVLFQGAPATGLRWRGRRADAVALLSQIPDGSGPDAFWAVFAGEDGPTG